MSYRIYEIAHPNDPWISQAAVTFLRKSLPPDGIGFEWGSGRSTAWLADRLALLVSVEHNNDWYRRVRSTLPSNVKYHFVPLDHEAHVPTVPNYDPLPSYVSIANTVSSPLDFVLIDGHYRQACVKAILPKLREGGLLAIDNTDWLPLANWGVPSIWPIVHQSRNVLTETTIWKKPTTGNLDTKSIDSTAEVSEV